MPTFDLPDQTAFLQNLLQYVNSAGFATTSKALAPGAGEANADSVHAVAIAYWLTVLTAASAIAAPATPVPTTAATGGTVLAGTYGAIVSYVNARGETLGSAAGFVVTSGATSTLTIPSPGASTGATGWYAYVTQLNQNNPSSYTRQQAAGSPTAIGTNLTLTAPPTSTGLIPQLFDTTGSFFGCGVVRDAYNHLTARQAYLRNPAVVAFTGDRV